MNENLIRAYVESAEPEINQNLRAGIITEDVHLFDSLFIEADVPIKLFRLLPIEKVNIIDGIICDSAYMSCTKDIDKFIDKVRGENIACLKINMHSPFRRICVNELLPNHNDEGEFILPRNLKLKVLNHQRFNDAISFSSFLDLVGSFESVETLTDIYHYNEIDLYELEIIE